MSSSPRALSSGGKDVWRSGCADEVVEPEIEPALPCLRRLGVPPIYIPCVSWESDACDAMRYKNEDWFVRFEDLLGRERIDPKEVLPDMIQS